MNIPKHILPVIVISQFCCTSLWFAGNGVMDELVLDFGLPATALGHLTSAVQFGFIAGTLLFALVNIADRFSPSRVFLCCALLGAACNGATILPGQTFTSLLLSRFFTGFFLAGIYPVGMKIAADYYEKGLGRSLGYLVGALVLGTAFPHLLNGLGQDFPWRYVLLSTSLLAVLGGSLMAFFVPDGPFRKPGQKLDPSAFLHVFRDRAFRSAAFGYFGHMWELYAFWVFVPVILTTYREFFPASPLNVPLWCFAIIGIGGLACVWGGYLSGRLGTGRVAFGALALSGACCLLSPLLFQLGSPFFLLVFLLYWGMVVIADSPLFSTLVAQHALPEFKGTALTIVTSIGFAITIASIQLLNGLREVMDPRYIYLFLAIGPAMGLWARRRIMRKREAVHE